MATLPRLSRPLARTSLLVMLVGLCAVLVSSAALAAEVRLGDEGFEPATVEAAVGENIVWVNATSGTQTIVGPGGAWDSGPLEPGETFSIALRQTGTVSYTTEDGAHTGRIAVTETAAPTTDLDPVEPALPETGLPAGLLALLTAGLVGAGALMVAAGRRTA